MIWTSEEARKLHERAAAIYAEAVLQLQTTALLEPRLITQVVDSMMRHAAELEARAQKIEDKEERELRREAREWEGDRLAPM